MTEHYRPEVLGRTAALYAQVLAWAKERQDVTVIGGWAVFELVDAGVAMQSRDVDIVLHTKAALDDLLTRLSDWNLTLRQLGRKKAPDAHFKDEDPLAFRLDLFTTSTNENWTALFGRNGLQNIKAAPPALFPSLSWTIGDKLTTLPLRTGTDQADKRAKDLIDLYHLIFHNKAGEAASALVHAAPLGRRRAAAEFIEGAVAIHPQYRAQLETLREWLLRA